MTVRENGCYRVRMGDVWRIAMYENADEFRPCRWTLHGVSSWFSDHDFDDIDSNIIPREAHHA